jgi:hypothetical protein
VAKTLRIGNAILCDHVVKGEGSKVTLVNAYSGDVVVSEMPATLMLGLFIELLPDPNMPEQVTITLRLDKQPFGRLQARLVNQAPNNPGMIALPVFEVGVEKDAIFDVVAEAPGFRRSTVLEKRIFKRPG